MPEVDDGTPTVRNPKAETYLSAAEPTGRTPSRPRAFTRLGSDEPKPCPSNDRHHQNQP